MSGSNSKEETIVASCDNLLCIYHDGSKGCGIIEVDIVNGECYAYKPATSTERSRQ